MSLEIFLSEGERREDINLLANYFAISSASKMQKQFKEILSPTLKILRDYDYPGNVRELQNIIERAVILTSDGVLHAEHLQLDGGGLKRQNLNHSPTLADFERRFILQTLKENNWQVGGKDGAAMRLGMKRTTLISKMEKLGINRQLKQQPIY